VWIEIVQCLDVAVQQTVSTLFAIKSSD
jgi:hypothetical protein